MIIGQTSSLSGFNYLQLGEGFFAEVDDPENAAKRRATDRTEASNKL